ncbi:MAG: RsmF rRNA methyltransferase first C-terminal domain-containing protein [Lactobacillus porci]|nr:RsmF rRNA methyltransferase first C-terminal domain-containing protein [Lactobacillus porci]
MLEIPAQFKEKFAQLLGEDEAARLFKALDEPSKKAFRINSLKKGAAVSYDLSRPVPGIPNAYYGEISGKDVEWTSGTVYSQDPAAMFPAHLTDVAPGDRVLDLCAAPGGKSTALGEKLQGQGLLVANEISPSRAKILRENLERWGVTNALVTNGSSEDLSSKFPAFFDEILVDAPCSGEGMFRKSEDAIKYWSEDNVLTCQARQQEILQEAVKMLKPGGQLVYSTCTFSPEEDEAIVSWLIDNYGFTVEERDLEGVPTAAGRPEWGNGNPELARCFRFWPQDGLGEGQFVALLRLPAASVAASGEKPAKRKQDKRKKRGGRREDQISREDLEYVTEALQGFSLPAGLENWSSRLQKSKDHVFVPLLAPDSLRGLKILSNGMELGMLKKKRFEPSHQLAEALGQVKQGRVVDLDEGQYERYLHGESLQTASQLKGFVLVASKGQVFSFGKLTTGGQLKNFYPKGLRQ